MLSIILPTINEAANLKTLIPQIYLMFSETSEIEVIVIDDCSTDDTEVLMLRFVSVYNNLVFVQRPLPNGLPKAILSGIEIAKGEMVAWLDADGSMPIQILRSMYLEFIEKGLDVVIGSRFVTNGGFKGLNETGKTSVYQFFKNLKNSPDRPAGIILSRLLNLALRIILRIGIKDLTSGFIITRKTFVSCEKFIGTYGEYFPILLKSLIKRGYRVKEFGYVCVPRVSGKSKTGDSLSDYLSKGWPYIYYSLRSLLK